MYTAAETLRAYWAAMETNDLDQAALFLAEDVIIELPQSNERITGRADFAHHNQQRTETGPWSYSVVSLVEQQDRVVTVTDMTNGTRKARAVTFSTICAETGLIDKQVEFWPEACDMRGGARRQQPTPPLRPSA